MKIADIVRQLSLSFPKYSDVLSVEISPIDSIFVSSTIVGQPSNCYIVTSDIVGITAGMTILLQGCARNVELLGAGSIVKDIYTFYATSPHDLTLGYQEFVRLTGIDQPEWNGSFPLIDVPSETTFTVESTNDPPIIAADKAFLLDAVSPIKGIDGFRVVDQVVAPNNEIVIKVPSSVPEGPFTPGTIIRSMRISGAVDIARALEQYTKQNTTDIWAFVVPNDVDVSKDMHTYSDATATRTTSDEFRLRAIDGFTIYLVKSTTTDMAAVEAVDLFRHDLLLPILKSVAGIKFPSGLTNTTDFRTILRGHGVASYNRAYVVYAYDFEQPADIVNDDVAWEGDTVAFRDIDYIHRVGGDDTEDATAHIDLDVFWENGI